MTAKGIGWEMTKIIHQLASIADEVRPDADDGGVVGEVAATISQMIGARSLEDDERIDLLEGLIMALATWIYRERKADFTRFVEESAKIVTLDVMAKMMGVDQEGAK